MNVAFLIKFKPNRVRKSIATFILALLFFLPLIYTQPGLNTTPLGAWREGSCNAVVQSGKTLFYTNGCILEIVVLDEDNFPQMVSFFKSRGRIYDLTVKGNLAYLAIEKIGMSIVSFEDLGNPVETGFCEYKQYYPQVLLNDHTLYSLGGSSTQVKVIDVSDPYDPKIIHTVSLQYISNAVLHGQYMYAACKEEGLRVYDLSDPGSIVEVYSRKGGYYSDVDIQNDLACVLVNDTLKILDVTEPENPVEIINYNMNSYAAEAKISENFVFTAYYTLRVIDISNPAAPVVVDEKDLPSNFSSLSVSLNRIFVATENGLLSYQAESNGVLNPMNHFQTPGLSNSLAVRDHYAYVCNIANGITILDILDPENPVPVQFIPVEKGIMSVKVMEQYLFVSNQGLSIYDISDPLDPQLLSYLALNEQSYKMYVLGDILYLAAGSKGLAIVDISNPLQPVLLSLFNTPGITFDMDIHPDEQKVYLADWNGGLRVIDVSNLSVPVEMGSITNSSFKPIVSVKVINQFAWIGSANFGIRIFDISNLANPVYVDDLNTSRGYDIEIRDQFAYVSSGYEGFYIYEISRFDDPKLILRYSTPGDVREAVFTGKLIYCADYYCGVSIFEFDQCALLKINSGKKDNRCFGNCEGSIEITGVDFALLPLQYDWSNGQSGPALSGLCSGTYTVTITDGKNCLLTESFTITEPSALAFAQIEKTDITAGSAGAISVQLAGGIPPYIYQWKGPGGFVSSSQNISGLAAGCYTLTASDANSCLLFSDQICILDLTSTLELAGKKNILVILPNPANDHIIIRLADQDMASLPLEKVEIYSATGQLVKALDDYQMESIDIQDLCDGLYLVNVTSDQTTMSARLMITR